MKRITLLVLFLMFVAMTSVASAEDVSGKNATMALGGHQYEMAFYQGPFGPGESGTVDITIDENYWKTLDFSVSGDIVHIDGLADFKFLSGGHLIWSQTPILIFSTGS